MKFNRMWVPESSKQTSYFRVKVIKEVHDQPAVEYPSVEKTLNMIWRHYY